MRVKLYTWYSGTDETELTNTLYSGGTETELTNKS